MAALGCPHSGRPPTHAPYHTHTRQPHDSTHGNFLAACPNNTYTHVATSSTRPNTHPHPHTYTHNQPPAHLVRTAARDPHRLPLVLLDVPCVHAVRRRCQQLAVAPRQHEALVVHHVQHRPRLQRLPLVHKRRAARDAACGRQGRVVSAAGLGCAGKWHVAADAVPASAQARAGPRPGWACAAGWQGLLGAAASAVRAVPACSTSRRTLQRVLEEPAQTRAVAAPH